MLVVIAFGDVSAAALAPQQASPAQPNAPAPTVTPDQSSFLIGPEDVLGILVWREADVSGEVVVRADGKITLPLIRDVQAAGLTPAALADNIQAALREFITDAAVTVVVKQMNSRKVFITGEVARPGAYPLGSTTTVMQLIALAGGVGEFANSNAISVLRVEDGRTRRFPFAYKDITRGRNVEQNITLLPGDTVVVPAK